MASEDEENNHVVVPSHAIQALTNEFRGGVGEVQEAIRKLREDLQSSEATTDASRRSLPKAEATIDPDHQAELARAEDKYDKLLEAYEQQALIISQLQSMRTRTGPKFGTPTDDEIINDFTRLKGAILQLVRNHIVAKGKKGMESIDPLWVQSQVASGLHQNYFTKTARPFGFRSTEINDALQRLEINAEILDYDGRMPVTPLP
ncbi:hypothetical protein PFICI_02537 [Pestalotiopsis fici W106-1]|uniref:Uncharacterized protein n=1 Tax=Pestalotiopsis fici (strain W106-1 / CGMCC3.15140) TaxID=1229662 RepID=W3XGF1_PESFW|nr:uncharacterized protein PFICI_02537 [Pestalotiopsis fici W106-1]ETS84512.1 hypothetical protein PFICI_02537 [Pestalotiopsis fici W106-1]